MMRVHLLHPQIYDETPDTRRGKTDRKVSKLLCVRGFAQESSKNAALAIFGMARKTAAFIASFRSEAY